MHIIDLLAQPCLGEFLSKYPVVMYVGEGEYPLLFFMSFLRVLRDHKNCIVESIDVQEYGLDAAKLQLETSFLGLSTLYWLRAFDAFDEKKRKQWFKYVASYAGPNTLMFFVEDGHKIPIEKDEVFLRVTLPHVVDGAFAAQLMEAFQVKPSQAGASMLARMFKRYKKISLDQLVHVMHYAPIVSSGSHEQVDELVREMIGAEQSLFTLGSLFFARQPESFFQLWSTEHDRFSYMFWCSFWSEQLLRATCYVHFTRGQNMLEAKKISSRLPFSFMQKDWKQYHTTELVRAHEYLYDIDFAIKNGSEAPLLDLFYAKFFAKGFSEPG